MDQDRLSEQPSVTCARHARVLLSGEGDFHVIKILAISDPSPPRLAESLAKDIGREILRQIDQMKDPPASGGLDQGYHCKSGGSWSRKTA